MKFPQELTQPDRVRPGFGPHFIAILCLALMSSGQAASAQSRWDGPILKLMASAAGPQSNTDPVPQSRSTEDSAPKAKESIWNQPMNGRRLDVALDYRLPLSGDYESFYGARLILEMWNTPRQSIGMTAGAGVLRLESGTPADLAAHDAVMFDLGIYYRFYFTPPDKLLRPYATVHLGLASMIWDYRNDPDSGGESVRHDGVSGGDASVGAGLEANVSDNFHLFGELCYGGIGMFSTTTADLKNRFFDSFSYFGLKTGLGHRF